MPKSYIDTDGRWVHTFRQSWLESANMCPEQARYIGQDEIPEGTTDAAAIGTAVHMGISVALVGEQIRDGYDPPDPYEEAHARFDALLAGEEGPFTWHMTKEYGARRCIDASLDLWLDEVYPTLQRPWFSEVGFGPTLFYEDENRTISLQGTMDYAGADGLKDWKTSSKPWTAWEKGRWAVQPTVYTWAAAHTLEQVEGEVHPFEFVVLVHEDDPSKVHLQRITVLRRPSDWDWLRHRCLAWAELIESGLKPWPLQDNGWHCSPKWCPAWDKCKGRFVHDTFPAEVYIKPNGEMNG